MCIHSHFAEELGKRILHVPEKGDKKEYVLESVSLTMLTCYEGQGNPVLIKLFINDCRIIASDKEEVEERHLPVKIVEIKTPEGRYIPAKELIGPSNASLFIPVEKEIIRVSGYSEDDFFNLKSRKKALVWARQIHMAIQIRILGYSLAITGARFKRDHATALSSNKQVTLMIETDKEWKDIHYTIFKKLVKHFGEEAEKNFDLKWLAKYE